MDCSRSVGEDGFQDSKDFVTKTLRLFDLSQGKERVSFITYDTEAYAELAFDDVRTTREALQIVRNATFCNGSTSVNAAFNYIADIILPEARNTCKIALFLLSDGQNNWGGDPETRAKQVKIDFDIDIYTIAIGKDQQGWDSLKRIASSHDRFFAVRNSDDIEKISEMAMQSPLGKCDNRKTVYEQKPTWIAFDITEYGKHCGRTTNNNNKCKDQIDNHCKNILGDWPWMAGIYVLINGNTNIICGGVLIGDCHVLTAAHCIYRNDYHRDNLLVVVGNADRMIDEKTEETHKVDEILVHNLFNDSTLDYDIALLKLRCNVTYSPYVRRVCMPDCSNTRELYKEGKLCTAAGWGATDYERERKFHLSTYLHHIYLPIANFETCGNSSSFPITPRMFCAGDASGMKGVCKGDSGGPFVCKRKDDDEWVLTGIVSWGEECMKEEKYDVFVRLCNEEIITWIQTQTSKYDCKCYLDESDCKCNDRPTVVVV